MRGYLPELIAALLLPWLLLQGRRTRRITPRLPEAVGPTATRTLYVPLALDTGDPALMAQDGYHPSVAGCRAWACLLGDACGTGVAAAHEASRDWG
jgi:hypothetical protein